MFGVCLRRVHAKNNRWCTLSRHSELLVSFLMATAHYTMSAQHDQIVGWTKRVLTVFHWEPEGCYCHILCTAILPFWFSMEHLWTALMPFWLSNDDLWIWIIHTCSVDIQNMYRFIIQINSLAGLILQCAVAFSLVSVCSWNNLVLIISFELWHFSFFSPCFDLSYFVSVFILLWLVNFQQVYFCQFMLRICIVKIVNITAVTQIIKFVFQLIRKSQLVNMW